MVTVQKLVLHLVYICSVVQKIKSWFVAGQTRAMAMYHTWAWAGVGQPEVGSRPRGESGTSWRHLWLVSGRMKVCALDLFEESKQVQAEADDLQRENKSDLLSVTAAVRMMLPPHLLMEIWQIELQKSQLIHFSVKLIFCLFFNIEHLCVLLLCSLHVFFTQIKRIIYRSESKRLWWRLN